MEIVTPHRVSRTSVQHLAAKPAVVFPLLCPVREADWIDGWDPISVFTNSGAAEPDCIFVTACRITIQLHPSDSGSDAVVTYSHTSLGPKGDAFVESFTEEYYRTFMQTWEARLNHYLVHGTILSSGS